MASLQLKNQDLKNICNDLEVKIKSLEDLNTSLSTKLLEWQSVKKTLLYNAEKHSKTVEQLRESNDSYIQQITNSTYSTECLRHENEQVINYNVSSVTYCKVAQGNCCFNSRQ
jgi:FtsZ-binding cell division protein ZapB